MVRVRILPPRQEPLVAGVVSPITTLERWISGTTENRVHAGDDGSGSSGEDHPRFDLGCWRFRVRSGDAHLLEDLGHLCRLLVASPRPEVDFTIRLIQCTEQGRLPGWGWTRERIGSG